MVRVAANNSSGYGRKHSLMTKFGLPLLLQRHQMKIFGSHPFYRVLSIHRRFHSGHLMFKNQDRYLGNQMKITGRLHFKLLNTRLSQFSWLMMILLLLL